MQDTPASHSRQDTPPEFERLAAIAEPFLRRLYFVAILTKYLGESAGPVIVGEHAVEYYTLGQYATGDLDLVCSRRAELDRLLSSWGFVREGRHWRNDALRLYVEAPAEALQRAEAARVVEGQIEGLPAFIIGPEDLIVDRLNAYVHWRYSDDGFWAQQIIRSLGKGLDWEYLQRRCQEESTLAALEEIRKQWEAEGGREG